MQCFVTVCDAGSISEAARRLGTAKSVISQRLQQLEKRVGSTLLERGRQVSLTEPGRIFHEHCLRILADVERAEEALLSFQSTLHGSLRLAAPMAFSVCYLSSILDSHHGAPCRALESTVAHVHSPLGCVDEETKAELWLE